MDLEFDFTIKSKNKVKLSIEVPKEIKKTLDRLKDIGVTQAELLIKAVKHIEPQLEEIEKDFKK